MTVVEVLEKRIEQHIQEMQQEHILHDVNERLRLEGQIRECNNPLFILRANTHINNVE